MTTLATQVSIADALTTVTPDGLPFRFTAYDGSATGPEDSPIHMHLASERGLSYVLTAPGDLGLVRAYVMGDLEITGIHPANPYELMRMMLNQLHFERPTTAEALRIVRGLGWSHLKPPPPPPQEHLPKWRRAFEGLRHSRTRDKAAIHHHYDVSNTFYEWILGPSMTYTCAVYPSADATLEQAQYEKYDLVARKLDLKAGQRLLDVGCGWGGMVRHAAREYGVRALGVTLSSAQAEWASEAIKREGLEDLAEVRFLDYRDVPERDFDAISSIGLTEHIGVRNYPSYFGFLLDRLKPGGRLLNHCITRPDNRFRSTGAFIDRYIFPDGELIGSGRIIAEAQDAGFEVRHSENLREHYALTLAAWSDNLQTHWDEAVAEVGHPIAKIWGLYLAACRVGFERNNTQLHQFLAVKLDPNHNAHFPLRPTWLT
ncbi:class I SAM-dependent methyltransferase [Kribbella capetownensis]|uniref:Class I SAM-dependent methyltransferase n=1 Tax=Kribbella capetownensis TaxID=1572659 RepID=A0A4R0JD24_9ACTN|nr:cyclopropane-fatty-acyl-phospholipid synthase family protein [Kribbella capetownensis]TCC44621.1 class I SAM-dependent methyltransferase [Kribbella capetownensis]